MPMAYSDYLDFRANQHSLQDLTVYCGDDFQITADGGPERIDGAYVSGSFFNVLGKPFLLGRPFGDVEDATAANVVVLSERLWRTRFHADSKVIGASITLSGRSFQIIGVTPEQANETGKIDLYLPFSLNPLYTDVKSRRSGHMDHCIGRLKDGVTLQQAQADFEVINQNLIANYPDTSAGFGIKLVPFLDSVVGDYSATLWLFGGSSGVLARDYLCQYVQSLAGAGTGAQARDYDPFGIGRESPTVADSTVNREPLTRVDWRWIWLVHLLLGSGIYQDH
jgi:hypothetical protein